MIEYKLTINELTVQLHHILAELYPNVSYGAADIKNCIVESDKKLILSVEKLGLLTEVSVEDMTSRLYRELGIEYEKNLHDKFYFEMRRDGNRIIFDMKVNDVQ